MEDNSDRNLCDKKDTEIKELKAKLQMRNFEIENLRSLLEVNSLEISRYGRQIILPQIGLNGQISLKNTSVLIVGAGGLGCPVGMYLAAAGIGKIGIVDYDNVELNNLHRQVLHTEDNVGRSKCESFSQAIKSLNSNTICIEHKVSLNSVNARGIITNYDILVDASDNAPTRYLLSDASVLFNKPLVSGSALRFEGQLIVYNYKGSACYRCIYPIPSKPSMMSNCSEVGVIGAVTGVIGSLQAMEVIKIAVGLTPSYANKLLHYDGESGEFRTFNIRGKNLKCAICGDSPKIKDLIDYEVFCQTSATDKQKTIKILSEADRITCRDYMELFEQGIPHILIDVRPELEFNICKLPNCINIPFQELEKDNSMTYLKQLMGQSPKKVLVVCRRGNDSQRTVCFLQKYFKDSNFFFQDITGGLEAWHNEVDINFPVY